MLELQYFSVTQILREINSRESRSSKTAVFANLRGPEFCYCGKFQPSKIAKIHKNQISEPLNVLKGQFFDLQNS